MNVKKQMQWMFIFLLMALSLTGCIGNSFTAIAAGRNHTCALASDGGVKCWGAKDSGQLGDATTSVGGSPIPVIVTELSDVAGIAAGYDHTCALTSSGGVRCWGGNSKGQLGDGTTTDRGAPVDVSGLTSGITAIAAGGDHTCALTGSGGVKCWGDNFYGRLGDGTTTDRSAPVDVSGLTSGITAIAAGYDHTCALTGSGAVKCWGENGSGQLGDGTTMDSSIPVDMRWFSGVKAIDTGNGFTCAVTSGGGVKCWGRNSQGQLGDGTTTYTYDGAPVDVSGLISGVTKITTGDLFACALTSAGGVKCWGYNGSAQLGDGTFVNSSTPVDVSGLTSGVTEIAAGVEGVWALTSGGGVKWWGATWNGRSSTPQDFP